MRLQSGNPKRSRVAILKLNTDMSATRTPASANTDQFPDRAGRRGPVLESDIATLALSPRSPTVATLGVPRRSTPSKVAATQPGKKAYSAVAHLPNEVAIHNGAAQ
jgi:hypothetical protein